MNQGRFPMKPQKKVFRYQNPPGFFPFVMKAFEFYNPTLNQLVVMNHKEDRISKAVNQLYSPSSYMCTNCGMRFYHPAKCTSDREKKWATHKKILFHIYELDFRF